MPEQETTEQLPQETTTSEALATSAPPAAEAASTLPTDRPPQNFLAEYDRKSEARMAALKQEMLEQFGHLSPAEFKKAVRETFVELATEAQSQQAASHQDPNVRHMSALEKMQRRQEELHQEQIGRWEKLEGRIAQGEREAQEKSQAEVGAREERNYQAVLGRHKIQDPHGIIRAAALELHRANGWDATRATEQALVNIRAGYGSLFQAASAPAGGNGPQTPASAVQSPNARGGLTSPKTEAKKNREPDEDRASIIASVQKTINSYGTGG